MPFDAEFGRTDPRRSVSPFTEVSENKSNKSLIRSLSEPHSQITSHIGGNESEATKRVGMAFASLPFHAQMIWLVQSRRRLVTH